MHLRTLLGASALACIAVGCSSSSNNDNGSPDSTVTTDSGVADAHADTRDAGSDTRDGGHDTADVAPDTGSGFDTEPVDIGPGDSSGLFPCGSDSCNTLLQFCEVDPGCIVTTPPPPTDSGSGDSAIDSEGDSDGDTIDDSSVDVAPETSGDSAACARRCVTYADADASTCLGFPSCACITSAICGGKGASCDDSSGGVIVSCNP